MMLCALFLFAHAATAAGAQIPSGYAAVMKAQYTAQAPAVPQRPEEAQRIYDSYLKSIGQKSAATAPGGTESEPH